MLRTFAVVPLLAVLAVALTLPGTALAGPPKGVSGKMALDEVADGLRKYRMETDPHLRIERLRRLSRTRDPRVGIALGEALSDDSPIVVFSVANQYLDYFSTKEFGTRYRFPVGLAREQWQTEAADLRRRAKQLPQ